ncbi:LCP family protein [Brachybacterium sp. JHP9]|uniref:LCP family protein n=1 Tax=Brachybacterium equifaecis TaxID=2910770 RepID=A0ABT0R3W6_9MICO|nr:LCP family protein [Brachybacterium equifaecis]MCL6423964.1 LCP family protein [Brachybacterium equifaecis]
MVEESDDSPASSARPARPGAPRRPVRLRTGGAVRPVASPEQRGGSSSRTSARADSDPSPTRPLPRGGGAPAGARSAAPSDPRVSARPIARGSAPSDQRLGAQPIRHRSTQSAAARAASGLGPADEGQELGGPDREAVPTRRRSHGAAGSHRAGSAGRRLGRWGRLPRPVRLASALLVLVLVLSIGWAGGLLLWANSRITHVDALSGVANTPGTTYLIAGSDARGGDTVQDDGTEGQRTDTMMLLHKAPGGRSYLVSLPRDTLVDIPGQGKYKLNAAYAFGGPALLVKTVEQFTGLTIDHYVEVGFDGVAGIVDAVGTVNLCIDQDVDDEKSGLKMTAGCHDVGGEQALAFVRARYFDPTADIGRQGRQQQFIGALMNRVSSPGVLLNPVAQMRLAGAGSAALSTDPGTGMIDLGQAGLTMRGAMNGGTNLPLPIADPNFQTKHSGVALLTDPAEVDAFFRGIEDGSATAPAAESAPAG